MKGLQDGVGEGLGDGEDVLQGLLHKVAEIRGYAKDVICGLSGSDK
jgi:hypothetical protein